MLTLELANKAEGLSFSLNLRVSKHALLDRWNGREQLWGSFRTPETDIFCLAENEPRFQEALCLLLADGDYKLLQNEGYVVGFQIRDVYYVTRLKEDELVVVTVHNMENRKTKFYLASGAYRISGGKTHGFNRGMKAR